MKRLTGAIVAAVMMLAGGTALAQGASRSSSWRMQEDAP